MHGNELTDRHSNSREIDHNRLMRGRVRELYTSAYYGAPWGDGTYSEWLELVPTYAYEIWNEPLVYSNLGYVRDALAEFGDDVREESQTLYVRLYRDNDRDKGYSVAAMIGLSLLDRLSEYPLLDEGRYSEIEWEMLERFASEDLGEMRERFPGICDACLTYAHIDASRYYGEFWVDLEGKIFRNALRDVWLSGYANYTGVERCPDCMGY